MVTSLNTRAFLIIGTGIVAIGFALRVFQIAGQEIWFDEGVSFHIATTSNWLDSMRLSPHPPLYYTLLRGWVSLTGSSEYLLRLPSAIFATLFIVAIIWGGKVIFDPASGLWSGAFVAMAPMHIYYAQEARSYALLSLLILLSYVSTWYAVKRDTLATWSALFVCQVATLGTHYFAVFALFPTIFLLILWPEPDDRRSRWLWFLAVSFASGLLLTSYAFWNDLWGFHGNHSADWIAEAWTRTPPVVILRSLEGWMLGGHSTLFPISLKQISQIEAPTLLRVLGFLVIASLATLLFSPWGEQRLDIPFVARRKWWLIVLAFLPLGALWLCSILYKPVYLAGRYDILAFPALALLTGFGLRKVQCLRIGGLKAALALLAVLALVQGQKLYAYYQSRPLKQRKLIAENLERYGEDGDLVLFQGLRTIQGRYAGIKVLYYLHQLGYKNGHCRDETRVRRFDCRKLTPAAWGNREDGELSPELSLLPEIDTNLTKLSANRKRIWLITKRATMPGISLTQLEHLLSTELTRQGFRARLLKPGTILFERP